MLRALGASAPGWEIPEVLTHSPPFVLRRIVELELVPDALLHELLDAIVPLRRTLIDVEDVLPVFLLPAPAVVLLSLAPPRILVLKRRKKYKILQTYISVDTVMSARVFRSPGAVLGAMHQAGAVM